MIQQEQRQSQTWLAELWEHLLHVKTADEELATAGRFFIQVMVLGLFLELGIMVVFLAMRLLGYLSIPMTWLAVPFPLGLMLLSAICIFYARQGHVNEMRNLYIGVTSTSIAVACIAFDGTYSSGWVLYLWMISVAAALLTPAQTFKLSAGILGLFAVVGMAEYFGIYVPPFTLNVQARFFNVQAFVWLMLVAVGFMSYLVMRNLHQTVGSLRVTTRELQAIRSSLEARVEERTTQVSHRAAQFQGIAEMSRAVSSILEPDQLIETAVHLIAERFDFYHVGVFLLDAAEEWVALQAVSSAGGQRMLERGYKLKVGSAGVVGYVAKTARPRTMSDTDEDITWSQNPDLPETRSELGLPLVARGHMIGVLDIQCEKSAVFSDAEIPVLRVLADTLAIAIENTHLLQDTRKVVDRLERYQDEDAVRGWRKALARRNMQVNYSYDRLTLRSAKDEELSPIADPQSLTKLTVIEQEGRNLLLVPIRSRNQTVGVLSFESQRAWLADDRQLAEQVVAQLGLALENARLLEDTRLSALQEKARGEIVSRVRASVQVDAILRSAAEELGQALQVERSRIQLIPATERQG
ncbi:MAG: GAF domain-containing protein [Anaerolineae bacterium]|jgi:GAF domain-containing protein|nr:GAF domain-containing protein [Anaerolineae bacterium]